MKGLSSRVQKRFNWLREFLCEAIAVFGFWALFIMLALLVAPFAMFIILTASLGWWILDLLSLYRAPKAFRYRSTISRDNYQTSCEEYIEDTFPPYSKIVDRRVAIAGIRPGLTITVNVRVLYCSTSNNSEPPGLAAASPSSSKSSEYIRQVENEKQTLLMLHGVGSSAVLMTSSVIADLSTDFNIFAIDIPAFGGSTTSFPLQKLSPEECIAFYKEFFNKLLVQLDLSKPPLIVAHSLGSFIAVESMWNWPKGERIKGLILISPAGLLPAETDFGNYLAMVFKTGVPMSLFRLLGSKLSSIIAIPLMNITSARTSARMRYWLQVQGDQEMVNISAKFLKFNMISAYWSKPYLPLLLQTSHDIGLIWGAEDTVTPAVTGHLLAEVGKRLGKSIVMETMEGVGHSPFHVEGGIPFATALRNVANQMLHPVVDIANQHTADKEQRNAQNKAATRMATLPSSSVEALVGDSSTDSDRSLHLQPHQQVHQHSHQQEEEEGAFSRTGDQLSEAVSMYEKLLVADRGRKWRCAFSPARTRARLAVLHTRVLQIADEVTATSENSNSSSTLATSDASARLKFL